jgi:hypothetical protein
MTINPASPRATRYCSSNFNLPLVKGVALLHSKLKDSTYILPSEVAGVLDHCQTFKTLDEHAREVCRNTASSHNQVDAMLTEMSTQFLPSFLTKLLNRRARKTNGHHQTEIEVVKKQLSEFVEMGLMISDADLLDLLNRTNEAPKSSEAIATIGIITCDRSDSLRHSLVSYIENCKKFGRDNDFAVMDDSGSPATRRHNRELLRSLKAQYDVDIFYAGQEEKAGFAEKLISHGDLPPEVVNFALFDVEKCGHSIGANRNALFLHTAGDMIFSADDDIACRIAPSPRFDERLKFFSEWDPTEFWFYPDRTSALTSTAFTDVDILAIHEQLLGKDLHGCVSALGASDSMELAQANSQFLQGLWSGAGEVLVTFNGIIGDSGMHTSRGYFMLDEDSRKRLLQSESHYRSAIASREVLRVANSRTISNGWWCATGVIGYDNRRLLPPFIPVQRGEDGLFGATLRVCFENAYFGHLPWALLHAPVEARSYSSSDLQRSASGVRLCEVLIACISAFGFTPGMKDGRERLRALGQFIADVGNLSAPDFEEFIRVQLWHLTSNYASRLEANLQNQQESPEYWTNDMRGYLNTLLEALPQREYFIPHDVAGKQGSEEALKLTRRLVFKFGQLLHWWPDIIKTAVDLRAENQRLAAAV